MGICEGLNDAQMYNNLYYFIHIKAILGLAWLKSTICQEKCGNPYFSSGRGDGWLCASVVIVVSDIGVQQYSGLSKQDDANNHIFGVEKSF